MQASRSFELFEPWRCILREAGFRRRLTIKLASSEHILDSGPQKIKKGDAAVILESASHPEHPVWAQPEIAGGEIVDGWIDEQDLHMEIISEARGSRFGKLFDFQCRCEAK